ncbi:hypothetical protein E2C01_024382 [Portunus trituberculatus]|uniref:Uncharacterized protein n=1 Tax=Portunus trituberculatus TaxID=210409 RepID=A0A5B7EEK2_PORTR|nr:hypothetical protein [Portunus trituberculatus]
MRGEASTPGTGEGAVTKFPALTIHPNLALLLNGLHRRGLQHGRCTHGLRKGVAIKAVFHTLGPGVFLLGHTGDGQDTRLHLLLSGGQGKVRSSKLSLSSLVCRARNSSRDISPLPSDSFTDSFSSLAASASESWERWEAGVKQPFASAGVSKVAGLFSMLRSVDALPSLAYFLNSALSLPTLLLSLASIYSILSFRLSSTFLFLWGAGSRGFLNTSTPWLVTSTAIPPESWPSLICKCHIKLATYISGRYLSGEDEAFLDLVFEELRVFQQHSRGHR